MPAPSWTSSGVPAVGAGEFGSLRNGPEPKEAVYVLTAVIVVAQVLASLALIFLILMHSGKGGGLSDMFGGSVGSAAAGSTVVERNLDRITITVAVVFAFTNLTLILRLQ
jgi:preprotein translocase subunit SecG